MGGNLGTALTRKREKGGGIVSLLVQKGHDATRGDPLKLLGLKGARLGRQGRAGHYWLPA